MQPPHELRSTVKLNILSDLHLSRGPLDVPDNGADVVVLAGDIARPDDAIAWASRIPRPVVYVPGNHECYGRSIAGTVARLRALCAGTNVRVLHCDEAVIEGIRFLGATLWTDFLLLGHGDRQADAVREALRSVHDFSRIRASEEGDDWFTPEQSMALFQAHAQWLSGKLAQSHPGPTVVVTHHAPTRHSIHARFAGSLLNAAFVSDAEHLIDGRRVQLWIHGHTHDSFDYRVNGTRVVCNPRGYVTDGVNENPVFDPDLVIDIQ